MLIDWFTVVAQTLNFLILVWLLKRFLYQPILDAIDAREQKIAAELADADAKKAQAQQERDEFQEKNAVFDLRRAELLSQAEQEAKAERQRLLNEARTEAEALRDRCLTTLKNDADNLNQAISRQTQQEVFAIVRKTLVDLASANLEEQLGAMFVRRLQALDTAAKLALAKALKTLSDPAVVRSAFELPPQQRAAIQTALNEIFQTDIDIRFEQSPDLVCGIELTANGWKIAWSIADYVATLQTSIGELLQEQCKPKISAETRPVPATDAAGTDK